MPKKPIINEMIYGCLDPTDLLLLLGPLQVYSRKKRQLSIGDFSLTLHCIEHPVRQLFGHVVDKFESIPLRYVYTNHTVKAKTTETSGKRTVMTNKAVLEAVGNGLHVIGGIAKRLGVSYDNLCTQFPTAKEGAPHILDHLVQDRKLDRPCNLGSHAFMFPGDNQFAEILVGNHTWERVASAIMEKLDIPVVSSWELCQPSFDFLARIPCFLPRTETIWDIAYWIASSRFFIGEESWVAHLAVALGVQTIILFPVESRSAKYRYALPHVRYIDYHPDRHYAEQDLLEAALAASRYDHSVH